MSNPAYVLGHSDREIARLKVQARLLEPITRQFLRDAGITAGMRVLDIGSGAGDVAFLAAALVGQSGEVIGSDTAAVAVAAATRRVEELGLHNVSFREGDPTHMQFGRSFDAIIGAITRRACREDERIERKLESVAVFPTIAVADDTPRIAGHRQQPLR